MRRYSLFIALILAFSLPAFAADKKPDDSKHCPMPKALTSPAFDLLKSLTGTWKGMKLTKGKKEPFQVNYRVTSGGTAVEETIFPGTPHEMVSIYVLEKGKIAMTHYCMMGNQPRLIEKDSSKNQIHLKLTKTPGINPKKDSYMGELILTLKDANHLSYKGWGYKEGKLLDSMAIELTRK